MVPGSAAERRPSAAGMSRLLMAVTGAANGPAQLLIRPTADQQRSTLISNRTSPCREERRGEESHVRGELYSEKEQKTVARVRGERYSANEERRTVTRVRGEENCDPCQRKGGL